MPVGAEKRKAEKVMQQDSARIVKKTDCECNPGEHIEENALVIKMVNCGSKLCKICKMFRKKCSKKSGLLPNQGGGHPEPNFNFQKKKIQ